MTVREKIYKEINLELKDTVEMMLSSDYKERFKAEYYQTKIRFLKLEKMLDDDRKGNLNFKLTDRYILEEQARYMYRYLRKLVKRAKEEGIVL